jgi:hypothetical protein
MGVRILHVVSGEASKPLVQQAPMCQCRLEGLVDQSARRMRGAATFASDGFELESNYTLKFRNRKEVEETQAANGFVTLDARDACDRPGRQYVFLTRRADRAT